MLAKSEGSVMEWSLICLLEILKSYLNWNTLLVAILLDIIEIVFRDFSNRLISNPKLPGISNKDSKDLEFSCTIIFHD